MRNFKTIQPVLSYVRRAVDDFNLIDEGAAVAAGVSGGKDSLAMLCALKTLSTFHPKNFTVKAFCIDIGFPDADFSPIKQLCEEIEVPFILVPSEIKQVVFDIRKEKCPCSLCAKMRRGILNQAAAEAGCRTVALGHHFDDAVETFFMNLFNEGRLGCFKAKSYLDRADVTVIRPMIYLREKQIVGFIRREGIKTCSSCCPEDGHTDRERIKNLIAGIAEGDFGLKERVFGAMLKGGLL